VLAVGKVKPPYADDVAHYERLLQRQARVEVIEVADDDAVARRVPPRASSSEARMAPRWTAATTGSRWAR